MKFIFFGTPKEAVIALDTLESRGLLPSLIVTAPDRPSGRGLKIEESPVAEWAKGKGIAVIKPESLRSGEQAEAARAAIRDVAPDAAIVFAYGKIIPGDILSLPAKGTLNIHPSLLPLHRGPAPVEGAILAGDKETGVSIMLLDAEMDHGPILAQEKTEIGPDETAPQLLERLVRAGAEKLAEILPGYLAGEIEAREQDHARATYTKKIGKKDGEVFIGGGAELYEKYRAYFGWPGIYFFDQAGEKPIRVAIKKASLRDGAFIIERVIPEGKKEMDYADYLRGKRNVA